MNCAWVVRNFVYTPNLNWYICIHLNWYTIYLLVIFVVFPLFSPTIIIIDVAKFLEKHLVSNTCPFGGQHSWHFSKFCVVRYGTIYLGSHNPLKYCMLSSFKNVFFFLVVVAILFGELDSPPNAHYHYSTIVNVVYNQAINSLMAY